MNVFARIVQGPVLNPGLRLPADDTRHPLAERFRDHIRAASFPCVGAKSALARGTLRVVVARDLRAGADDGRIHAALMAFIARYRAQPDLFQSLAVLFEAPGSLAEDAFEAGLWARIQALTERDSALGQTHSARHSADPGDPHFSFSVAGEALFVVGLHPGASRPARRFSVPALVFNPHAQFETLRTEGRYERLRASILDRDVALAGSANPMIARHGERSEAAQYSGRVTGPEWQCPFHRPAAATPADALTDALLSGGAFAAGSAPAGGRGIGGEH